MVEEEAPIPEPGPRDVVIAIRVCGVCATDVHSYQGETIQGKRYPFHPGHEIAGVVYNIGSWVTGVEIGDKVVVDPLYPCRKCEFCVSGKENHCLDVKTLGTTGPGGYSDFTVVPMDNVHRFETMSFHQAAFAEPLSTVIYGTRRARLTSQDNVLIQGMGPIGLLHLQVALGAGVRNVIATDLNPAKLRLAEALGASMTFLASEPDTTGRLLRAMPRGFDVVIDCTGVPSVVEQSISLLKNTGRLLLFGVCPEDSVIQVSPFKIYRRDLEIIGSYALNHTMGEAVRLLEFGKVQTDQLIAKVMERENVEDAFKLLAEGKVDGKIQIAH